MVNLNTQLRYFKKVEKHLRQKLGDEESKKLLLDAVYFISIGSNDYISPLFRNYSMFYSQKQYLDMVMGNLTVVIEVIQQSLLFLHVKLWLLLLLLYFRPQFYFIFFISQEIYQKGGRKFGFVNMGPLGCIPAMEAIKLQQGSSDECLEEATVLAKLHNTVLPEVLQGLESKLKGFKYSVFDFYTTAKERMDNPSKYGTLYCPLHICMLPHMTKMHLLCYNLHSQFMLPRFQRSEESMLRLRPLQGPVQLWRDERNNRI